MPTSMVAIFDTKYSGSGADQAVAGFSKVDNSLNKIEGSSDRLVTKLERPLGRIAYGGLAEGALSAASANAKLDGVTGALHQTFHILGSSLLFVNPELGFLALGASAVVILFEKLSHATMESAENIAHNTEIQRQLKEEYKESSDLLLKNGLVTKDQAKILRDAANATEDEIKSVKDGVRKRIEALRLAWEEEKSLHDRRRKLGVDDTKLIAEAYKAYQDGVKTSTGLLGEAKHTEDEHVKSIENHYKALGEVVEKQARLAQLEKDKRDYEGIDKKVLDDLIVTERELVDLTLRLNEAKTESDRKELQAHIDYLTKRVSADKTTLSAEKSVIDQRAKVFGEYDRIIADQWLQSNHNMQKVGEAVLAKMLTDVADYYATKLEIGAAADIFENPGLAIAELAAAATIRTIGGGLASDLTGGNSGGGLGATAVSSSGGSGSSSGMDTSPRPLSLSVYVEGHILGGEAALGDKLASIISDRVVAGGAKLVSSSLVLSGGTAPR